MTGLALDVVRECRRGRLFHLIPAVCLALFLLAPVAADLSMGARLRAVEDLGLWVLTLVQVLLAIAVGIRAIGAALDDRSAWLVLARPIGREQWVLGRAVGAFATVGLTAGGLVLAWLPIAAVWGLWDPGLIAWGLALWVQGWLVTAWAMCLSALARGGVAAFATLGLCVAGALADEYLAYATELGAGLPARLLFAAIPDLDVFAVQERLVHDLPVDPAALAWATAYAAAAAAVLVLLTRLAVARRELA